MSRGRASLTALGVALALAGCGYSRSAVPDVVSPAPPDGFTVKRFPAAGVMIETPRAWTRFSERPPLLVTVASGQAVIALWRYRRHRPLPADPAQLSAALSRLVAAAQLHQPQLRVLRATVVHLAGVSGIELSALEPIKGALRRVRSTHLYAGREEIVLEEYAPLASFHAVDHAVFSPVRRSLRVTIAR